METIARNPYRPPLPQGHITDHALATIDSGSTCLEAKRTACVTLDQKGRFLGKTESMRALAILERLSKVQYTNTTTLEKKRSLAFIAIRGDYQKALQTIYKSQPNRLSDIVEEYKSNSDLGICQMMEILYSDITEGADIRQFRNAGEPGGPPNVVAEAPQNQGNNRNLLQQLTIYLPMSFIGVIVGSGLNHIGHGGAEFFDPKKTWSEPAFHTIYGAILAIVFPLIVIQCLPR